MVGYPESLTDPSFTGQILVLTFPSIGNYGVPDWNAEMQGIKKNIESDRIRVAGLIVGDYSHDYSHCEAISDLSFWLQSNNIPAIGGIDTRSLTKYLRSNGSTLAQLIIGQDDTQLPWIDPNEFNLVQKGSYNSDNSFD